MISSIRTGFTTNQMKQTQNQVTKYQKQISSGKKVNTAADDAAALSISQKMLKQIGTYKQKSSNITSSISSNRIAEGALSGVSDTYNDMYANSIRSMNGIMSESDINDITKVNDSLKASTGQVAATTKFNENFVVKDINTDYNSIDAEAISSQASSVTSQRSKLGAEENGLVHQQAANDIAAENTTAALSRKVDTEMEKAISAYKTQSTMGQFQNAMLSNQLKLDNGITALFNN